MEDAKPLGLKWKQGLLASHFGDKSRDSNVLFSISLFILRKIRPDYHWVAFLKESSGYNSIRKQHDVIEKLSALFRSELADSFSSAHIALLENADCILVGINKANSEIVCFGSTKYSKKGSLSDIDVPHRVTHGGLLVVAKEHARSMLGTLISSVIALYGHTIHTIFEQEVTVLRINNKHLERVMRRAGPVYRYDQLSPIQIENDPEAKLASSVIEWTHKHVFYLNEPLELGKPLNIQHRFSPKVRMSGLGGNEITYAYRKSSLVYFVSMVLIRASS